MPYYLLNTYCVGRPVVCLFHIDVGVVTWPPARSHGHACCSTVAIYLRGLVCGLAVRSLGHCPIRYMCMSVHTISVHFSEQCTLMMIYVKKLFVNSTLTLSDCVVAKTVAVIYYAMFKNCMRNLK